MSVKDDITKLVNESKNKNATIKEIRKICAELSDYKSQPIDNVIWVPIEKVTPNDYNPNSVAKKEMQLLYISIKEDGYTQPVVTVYDKEKDMYVIVDGFHRYFVCKTQKDICERNHGMLPIVVLNKTMNERMAATVRHNRARGSHAVTGMSNLVFNMLQNGWSDAEICKELGMEKEEIVKLKYITGFAKLFENSEYSKSWKTEKQIQEEKHYNEIYEKTDEYKWTGRK